MCRVICILSVADESSDVYMHAAASGESSTTGYCVVFSLIENGEGKFMFVKRGKNLVVEPVPCGRGRERHKAVQIEPLLPVPPALLLGAQPAFVLLFSHLSSPRNPPLQRATDSLLSSLCRIENSIHPSRQMHAVLQVQSLASRWCL